MARLTRHRAECVLRPALWSRQSSSNSRSDQKMETPTPLRLRLGKRYPTVRSNIRWTIFFISLMSESTRAKALDHKFAGVTTMLPASWNLLMTPLNVVGRDAKLGCGQNSGQAGFLAESERGLPGSCWAWKKAITAY